MNNIQLSIPTPCHENWGNMQPDNDGRFCNACAKSVVDFTSMSDAQLVAYFSKPANGNVCGRANSGQLERILQAPARPRKKLFFYWQYVLTLLLFFARGNTAKAQGEMRLQSCIVKEPANKPSKLLKGSLIVANKQPDPEILMGDTIYNQYSSPAKPSLRITNAAGAAIPFASITLVPGNKILLADYDGIVANFNLQTGQEITVTAVGYESLTITAANIVENNIILSLKPVMLDTVVVTSSQVVGSIRMGGLVCRTTTIRTYQDSMIDFFAHFSSALTIYPNPVQKAAGLTVNFNADANQLYHVRVSAANGKVLLQQNFTITGKKASLPLQVPADWSNGVYFLTVYDAKQKSIGTVKFMVQ